MLWEMQEVDCVDCVGPDLSFYNGRKISPTSLYVYVTHPGVPWKEGAQKMPPSQWPAGLASLWGIFLINEWLI